MKTYLNIAWIEWYRAFTIKQSGGGNGRRDFFWLSLLLWLTLTLALFVWGSRAGLLDQFVNVSLGYVRGSGIPIWVIAGIAGSDNVAIDRRILQRMQALPAIGDGVHPYREVERHEVSLPGSYENTAQIFGKKPEDFYGWAVSQQDPLWQLAMPSTMPALTTPPIPRPFPLDIVLNRALFQRHFHCQAYRDILAKKLPMALQPPAPSAVSDDRLACLANDQLWLEAKLGNTREFIPFRIHWQARIPTMVELAFLLPLTTFHALKLTYDNPNLRYYPEDYGQQGQRVKQLWIRDEGPAERDHERYAHFAHCLGHAKVQNSLIILTHPKPMHWVEACATQQGIRLQTEAQNFPEPFLKVAETEASHPLSYESEDMIRLPCQALKPDWRPLFGCTSPETQIAKIDVLKAFGGYLKALIYVRQRTELSPTLHALQALPRSQGHNEQQQALYVDPVYQDAIARFNFISDVLEMLSRHYGVFFVLFLLVLLGIQTGIVIGHRRHNYGVFLAKGMAWGQIRAMVLVQMALSFTTGFGGALLALWLLRFSLHTALERLLASEHYKERIFSTLDLLPLLGRDYVLIGGLGLLLTWIMAMLLLRLICPTQRLEPSRLLHT